MLQVTADVVVGDRIARAVLHVEGPGLDGAVNLLEIVQARVGLSRGAGLNVIGDGESSQQANDHDDDHDLDQRKTTLAHPQRLPALQISVGTERLTAARGHIETFYGGSCQKQPQVLRTLLSAIGPTPLWE